MELDDKHKFQGSGLRFLYEMELVDDPQLINNMKLNILMLSNSIKEVEFLSVYETKQMLILLELSWFGRTFFRNHICAAVQERVQQLLPNFSFRVTDDPKIMDAAKERVRLVLQGGKDEVSSNSDAASEPGSGASQSKLQEESDSVPDSEESSED